MGGGRDATSCTMALQAGGLVAPSVSDQPHWQSGLPEVIGGNIATQPTGWHANFPQNETRSSYRYTRRKLQSACGDPVPRECVMPAARNSKFSHRLYPTCRLLDDTEVQITFQSVFHASCDRPIFSAELQGCKGQFFAKMTSRQYGASVHRFLGNRSFAPKLLGECTLDS